MYSQIAKTKKEKQHNFLQIKSQLDRLTQLTDCVASYRCSKCAELQIKIRQKDEQIQQLQSKHSAIQKTIFQVKSRFNQQCQILNTNYSTFITQVNKKIKTIQEKYSKIEKKQQHLVDKHYRRIKVESFQEMSYQSKGSSNKSQIAKQKSQDIKCEKKSASWDQYYVDKLIFGKLRQFQLGKEGKSNNNIVFQNMKLLSQLFQQNSQIRILIQKSCYLIKLVERSSGFRNQQIEYLNQVISYIENNVLMIKLQKNTNDSVRSSAILDQFSFQQQTKTKVFKE